MPWTQTEPEMERRKFVQAALRREESMKVLRQRFGISRKTGYKMLARHAKSGQPGLADVSRAPKAHPNQTPPEKEAAILRVRKAHPTWGSKKILWTLDRERPDEDWPARSTVDEILRRAGVVEPRGRRPRRQPSSPPKVEAKAPNDVWSMDYKGWFRLAEPRWSRLPDPYWSCLPDLVRSRLPGPGWSRMPELSGPAWVNRGWS